MRSSLILAVVLTALTIAAGCWTGHTAQTLSEKYISAAEELLIFTRQAEWSRAQEAIAAYHADWRRIVPWLQILINHEDIDDVTLSLTRLQTAVARQDAAECAYACAELLENARHIYHRDALTLGNIL